MFEILILIAAILNIAGGIATNDCVASFKFLKISAIGGWVGVLIYNLIQITK